MRAGWFQCSAAVCYFDSVYAAVRQREAVPQSGRGVTNQILGGWEFSTITSAQDDGSITTRSWDAAGQAIVPDGNRLNCVAGVAQVAANPTADLYFLLIRWRGGSALAGAIT